MMSSFEPGFVASIASKVVEMIKDCDDEYFPKVFELKIFNRIIILILSKIKSICYFATWACV